MKTKTAKDILIKALGYIRKGWTQGYYAKSKSKKLVDANSRAAACWCMIGALDKAAQDGYETKQEAINFLLKATKADFLVDFNDKPGRKKSEVIAAFKKAIKLASGA